MNRPNWSARRFWAACGLAALAFALLGAGIMVNDTYQYLPVVYRIDPTFTAITPTGPPWLIYLNSLRALGGLPPVTENVSWSDGDWKHSRYCVKNNTITHEETPGNPWYTAEGAAAGQNGNVAVSSDVNATDNSALDGWMISPFHGVGMIDPALLQAGFGSYREAIGTWRFAATLDVLRGRGAVPGSVAFPVRWPGSGASMPYTEYDGYEWPDPLTTCSFHTAPTGPPIYLLLGPGDVTPSVTAHSFVRVSDGAVLQDCIFDQTNYNNPNSGEQSLARSVLNGRNAIVLLPRNTLTRGAAYTVSITTNGQTYTWSFTVAAGNGPEAPVAPMLIR